MVDTLEVIKFVCKELWGICWGKMVDGLKTNHRGTYVVTDLRFKVFERMSTERGVGVVDRAQVVSFVPIPGFWIERGRGGGRGGGRREQVDDKSENGS